MSRFCLMITTIAVAIFVSGCHAIMTTAPLVDPSESCRLRLTEGIYTVYFYSQPQCVSGSDDGADQSRTSTEVDVSYDKTNRIYRIVNLANSDRYVAAACERADGCYVSLTAEKPDLDKLGLSEDERIFVVKGYINLQLKKNENGWGVFAMSSDEAGANPILGYDNGLLKEYVYKKKQYPFKHVAELRRRDEAGKKIVTENCEESAMSSEDKIPEQKLAQIVQVVEAKLVSAYGDSVLRERPWKVKETATGYEVMGSPDFLKGRKGGVARMVLDKDLNIMSVTHGK